MGTRLILCLCLLLCASSAHSQPGFEAWVGLYERAQIGWLENENRLPELCTDATRMDACYREKLAPLVVTHRLRTAPADSSRPIGDLIVVAVPGRGLSAHFQPADGREIASFEPDLYLQDWGYGPYFHHTISARTDEWFRLPPGPWEEEAWIHRADPSEGVLLIHIQPEDIVAMGDTSWIVLEATADELLLRPEQPADHWCEEGDPPPLLPSEPRRFLRPQLLGPDGHLLLRLKYLKGC